MSRISPSVTAFDLDGCLIDSEELIRQSYRDAGTEAPEGFLALGHHDWIEGDRAAVHARKDAAYLRRLAAEPFAPLPPWDAAEALHQAGQVVALLTGAPAGTVQVLARRAPSWPFALAQAALTPDGKTAWMASVREGAYVDDQEYVAVPDGWRFVRYAGQDAAELCRLVTCP